MASSQRSLSNVFGTAQGSGYDLGRAATAAQAPVPGVRNASKDQVSAMLSIPVVLAMGGIIWLALRYAQ